MSDNNIDLNATEKEEFENNMSLLHGFMTHFSKLPEPETDLNLHTWMRKQMDLRRISYTPRKKVFRLTAAGESWIRQEDVWFGKLLLVKEYIEQNNSLPDNKADGVLLMWLKAQLAALESGMNMPADKKNQLLYLKQDILHRQLVFTKKRESYVIMNDFSLTGSTVSITAPQSSTPIEENKIVPRESITSINKQWFLMLIDIVIFKEQNGRWPRYKSFDTSETPLTIWCENMRFKYKKGVLSDTRINYLNGIRFPF